MELILVLFGLLAVCIPFAIAYLLWRTAELRRRVLKLTELTMELNDGLRRDLMELKRKVEAQTHAVDAPIQSAQPVAHTGTAMASPAEIPIAPVMPPVAKPVAVPIPLIIAHPIEHAVEHPVANAIQHRAVDIENEQEPFPAAPAPPSVKPEQPPAERPAPATVEQKPVRVSPAVPTIEPPAHKPMPPAPLTLPHAAVTQPHGSSMLHVPASPPPASARVVPQPQFATLRTRSPRPTAQQRMKWVLAFEEILGTNWLSRIGISLIVIGVATFGIYKLGHLGPLGKVLLSFSLSLAFLGAGIFIEKRDRYRIFSYALIGGGWALLFWTTYALNHVQAMRVMSSETTDLILMLAVAAGMVVHTLRYRSQVVTGLAFLLTYATVSLSHDDVYSLASGVILAIGLVTIVLKMGWFELEVFGILSSYLNHFYWLYRVLGPTGAHGTAFPEYHASTAILLFYWLTYRASYVMRKPKSPRQEHVSTAAALLNTLLLLGTMKFQSVHPELAFWALLIIGAVEFTLAQLPITKRRREAFVVLSVLGAALMIASVPFRYSGNNVAILWLIGAEVLLAAGVVASEVVFRRLGLLTALLVGLHLIKTDFPQLIAVRRSGEDIVLAAGIMFALCAIVFYLNALFVGSRWARFFSDSPDSELINIHSYLGGFSAMCGAWALCSGDWTALAFAGIMLTLARIGKNRKLGKNLKSRHLQLQYGAIGLVSLYRVAVFNLHVDVPQYTHVATRLITLPIVAAAFYLTAKFAAQSDEANQRTIRGLFALAGTLLFTALIYFEVPELWQPLAAIVFAVVLLEVGRQIGYDVLAWHTHLLTGLAVLAASTADRMGLQRWHDIPLHAFGALPVVAGAYWIARRVRVSNEAQTNLARVLHSWVGTGLMVWVLYEAVPQPWIAVAWILLAIALALVLRGIRYSPLAWQANAVAACAVVRVYTFDMQQESLLWQGISLRMVTISSVAAGLYFLSRQAAVPDSPFRRPISYLHTTAATALLALLAWYEAPGAWLAAVWAVFALALALVDRRFDVEELAWQAHALAALAMLRGVTLNLHVEETWHGVSVRLLSLTVVTVAFYALSRIIRMPEDWRKREFQHIYSWAASALVGLLMWYELQPLSVAVGWAVFGLILFEYGLWSQTRQFRMQAYLALAASFGRIFFANLTAGTPGEFWGPRIYTVLPIALILFFVYAQLGPGDQNAKEDRRLRLDVILAYLGTGTVVALLYFQYPNDWLVTAWAIVVLVLFALDVMLDRPVFLHQGLLLTLGACTRGLMHNLFGASYFSGGDWAGRYFVLGSGIAVLLACLPLGFRLRDRNKTRPCAGRIARLAKYPEQFLFFMPVLLLTVMLAVKMRAGMITVSWGVESLAILIFAFLINERSYRLTGLFLLLVSFVKILFIDMWSRTWSWPDRYITFLIVGAAMFLASFLYTRYSEKIRQFL